MIKKTTPTRLTASLLRNFPFNKFTYPEIVDRGMRYYRKGAVKDISLSSDGKAAVCIVSGTAGSAYKVTIRTDNSEEHVDFYCSCPYGGFCKHCVASAYAVADYLTDDTEPEETPEMREQQLASERWKRSLGYAVQKSFILGNSANVKPRSAIFLLMHCSVTEQKGSMSVDLSICMLNESRWSPLRTIEPTDPADPDQVNRLLSEDHSWINVVSENPKVLKDVVPINISSAAYEFFNSCFENCSFWNMKWVAFSRIESLYNLGIPIFQMQNDDPNTIKRMVFLEERAKSFIRLEKDKNGEILATYEIAHSDKSVLGKAIMLSKNPILYLSGNKLFRMEDDTKTALLHEILPVRIPAADVPAFREDYFPQLVEGYEIFGSMVKAYSMDEDPVPRLYLTDNGDDGLDAELRFAYDKMEVMPSKHVPESQRVAMKNSWNIIRFTRNPSLEGNYCAEIASAKNGLKKVGTQDGKYTLRAKVTPYEFLVENVPNLQEAGFEVYGEEKLKNIRINRSTPRMKLNLKSEIDWFDLQAVVTFGSEQVPFKDLRNAIRKGKKYIKLPDKSIGMIPDEWIEKYKYLFGMGEDSDDGFRISMQHAALFDSVMDELPKSIETRDLKKYRDSLKNFSGIKEQKIPDGLKGELRSYQKNGFDWLYFLYEHHFGGILADDMGLGKTIQVLTFLLSLKERAAASDSPHPVCLLVVPKSLIANWQQESEKFTPDLTFMPFVGGTREKDIEEFNNYDIILTTYGTLLHDVDLMKKFRFHMIVLDESQAIKNPLAKSSRAVRTLQGEHRLVMTGTPVENNTLELWSQFAFISPGFLGNVEYFKANFAYPIEMHHDEEAGETLKKLIFPFIMRRTKLQVAKELPPKIERIAYVEMSPEQQRVYKKTCKYYQDELLGLVEKQGMEGGARFKILEGLLRLRQIAIHPKLVDDNYDGEAPKIANLLEMMETLQGENHKALIFSQFVQVLSLVREELDIRKIPYEYLDGQTNNREKHVEAFQTDPDIPFFLISLKAGGVGLNLTAADYVIHLDPWWNPAVEVQASDRAHRIGQDKSVFIYKLITQGTVEEKILQLQEKKKGLVDSLITTENGFFKSLTADDVRNLFS